MACIRSLTIIQALPTDLLGVRDEVVGDLLLRGEGVGGGVGELQPREAVVPRGAVRDQGVPPLRAPSLGDAVPFQNDVRYAVGAQVLAHRHAGLARPDDDYFILSNRCFRYR
jgi:hypothetical protein